MAFQQKEIRENIKATEKTTKAIGKNNAATRNPHPTLRLRIVRFRAMKPDTILSKCFAVSRHGAGGLMMYAKNHNFECFSHFFIRKTLQIYKKCLILQRRLGNFANHGEVHRAQRESVQGLPKKRSSLYSL